MNGLLFPGQGSQIVGMGKELYEASPAARDILDSANELLGQDIRSLMFNGPQNVLTDTRYAQTAIYTCSAMYLKIVQDRGLEYSYVAGHSLGEYNALLAAGVFGFEEGLRLVKQRGEVMSRMNGKGTMAAVLGLCESDLAPYLNDDVVVANINSKTEIVISGSEQGIERVGTRLRDLDAVKFKPLKVSAAFHSPQMSEAESNMAVYISDIKFCEPRCYVVSNTTGKPSSSAREIKENLISQITGQVRWCDSIIAMKNAGVSVLYEVGYGDTLKKLSKTITFRPKCIGVEV